MTNVPHNPVAVHTPNGPDDQDQHPAEAPIDAAAETLAAVQGDDPAPLTIEAAREAARGITEGLRLLQRALNGVTPAFVVEGGGNQLDRNPWVCLQKVLGDAVRETARFRQYIGHMDGLDLNRPHYEQVPGGDEIEQPVDVLTEPDADRDEALASVVKFRRALDRLHDDFDTMMPEWVHRCRGTCAQRKLWVVPDNHIGNAFDSLGELIEALCDEGKRLGAETAAPTE